MQPRTPTHPAPDVLAAFGLGKLNDSAALTIAKHLETCASCRQAVEKAGPDSFIGRVRAVNPPGSRTQLPAGLNNASPPKPPNLPSTPLPTPKASPPLELPPELANHPKFLILSELGRGGMGVVYKAQHRFMEILVALKVINKSLLDNSGALERFDREVRAAAKLDHPHIVRALDADRAGDLRILVMEFVEGANLQDVLDKKGPLPIPHACHYIRQAALGLQYAHEQGMVHRDIKPQNLILTPRGQVKILDFGLARLVSERKASGGLTQMGDFMGTPHYMAPEQALDASQADIRADLYSLACTLYSLLTGTPPFNEDTVVKLVMAHMEKEAPGLERLRSDVPRELAEVMRRMLAKDPAHRFQAPVEVAQALAPFCKAVQKTGVPGEIKPAPRSVMPLASPMVPPKEASPFAEIRQSVSSPRKERRPARQPAAVPTKWWLLGGLVASVLLIGLGVLLGSGIFKGPTKEGTLPSGEPKQPGIRLEQKREPEKGDILSNSIGMKLVYIPKGTFSMGSPNGEDEKEHDVEITKGFYLGVYEVTQEEYEKVMGTNPSYFSARGNGKDKVEGLNTKRFPVENVSYEDAQKFCAKLSEMPEEKQKKRLYRLPTEAEWEYAVSRWGSIKNPLPLRSTPSPQIRRISITS